MQELLPFGEYVPPENGGLPAAFLGFEAWDMDHLLQRLALQSGSHPRRPRTRSRTRAQSLQGPPHGKSLSWLKAPWQLNYGFDVKITRRCHAAARDPCKSI